ncbi:MAG: aldose epimerase [Myxococcaceae bacterium]
MSTSAAVEQRHGMKAVVLKAFGAEAEVLPERGALVSRWAVAGDELLYLDAATVVDRSKNVRGGVPVLFPVAGRVKGPLSFGGKPVALEQHGFARKRAFEVAELSSDDATARVAMRLVADEQTRAVFPFEFDFDVIVTLEAQRLTVELVVKNTGAAAMPVHLGLHPYFRVPAELKAKASVKATATRAFDLVSGAEGPWAAPKLDGPEVNLHLLDAEPAATLVRGDGKRVQVDSSAEMHGLVFWTTPGQPFVCVEPWSDPVDTFGKRALGPGETAAFASAFTVS